MEKYTKLTYEDFIQIMNQVDNSLEIKEEFISTGSSSAKDMSKQELGHFLMNLKDMFKELNEHSKDDIEERSMVKSAIKEIYQLFS